MLWYTLNTVFDEFMQIFLSIYLYTSLNICLFFMMLCCSILEKNIIFKYTLYVYLFFFFWGWGWVIICEISKITVNFWQLTIFLTTLYMYLNPLSWTQWNLKKTLRYLMICNMITQWLPQDLKLTSKYLWYSGYHNVCNIRVQTIYTYKNLNNSGEKW